MNENQDSDIVVRLHVLLAAAVAVTMVAAIVSYRVGKGQAYKEIVKQCIENKVSAGICFLDSKESVDNVIRIINEVMEEEVNEGAHEEVEMLLNQKKV